MEISDEVTVMRDGKFISTDAAADLTIEEIIRRMVGRELTNMYPSRDHEIGDELLRVEHLSARYQSIEDISFSLRKGEILGLPDLWGRGGPRFWRLFSE